MQQHVCMLVSSQLSPATTMQTTISAHLLQCCPWQHMGAYGTFLMVECTLCHFSSIIESDAGSTVCLTLALSDAAATQLAHTGSPRAVLARYQGRPQSTTKRGAAEEVIRPTPPSGSLSALHVPRIIIIRMVPSASVALRLTFVQGGLRVGEASTHPNTLGRTGCCTRCGVYTHPVCTQQSAEHQGH
jgi:hypothetical protein